MSRPVAVTLSKKDQRSVLSAWKKGTHNARRIAEDLNLKRHWVMFFLESQGLTSFSEGSYS